MVATTVIQTVLRNTQKNALNSKNDLLIVSLTLLLKVEIC
jgi:hypothetical protein